MSDIRSFFGGKKPVKKDASTAIAPDDKRKHAETVEDLCDSDSDKEVKHERKRFRSLKEKASAPAPAPAPAPVVAPPGSHSSPISVEASSSFSYTEPLSDEDMVVAEPSPAKKYRRTVTQETPKPDPNLKEVKGVHAFFGLEAPPAPPVAPKTPVLAAPQTPVASPPDIATSSLPLSGKQFVITGVLDGISREDVSEYILNYGGKVKSAISRAVDYLVAGRLLEDGRDVSEGTKYKIPIIQLDELRKMVGDVTSTSAAPSRPLPPVSRISAAMPARPVSSAPAHSEEDELWVEKYRPKSMDDMVGSAEYSRKLIEWLRRWEDVHVHKTYKPPFNAKENMGAKAVLLSGPPGIGKSTLAGIISKHMGYTPYELNASDSRNKAALVNLVDITNSLSISQFSSLTLSTNHGSKSAVQKRVVIMDEVDGMSSSDRGGIAELIKVIKASKCPIICICNDRHSQKLKSLVNHCLDMKISRPNKINIVKRLCYIANKEGLQLDPNAGEVLVEQSGNDIRQAINTLQLYKQNFTYSAMKTLLTSCDKDKVLRQTPFDSCGNILSAKGDVIERYNSFFVDYSLVPLLVQQNYIDSARNGIFKQQNVDDCDKMDRLSRAADAVSDMDLAGSSVRGNDMHWELLPAQAALSVAVGSQIKGFQSYPTFPAWLGKNSSTNKNRRLTQEIVVHTALSIDQGFSGVRLDYIPFLRYMLLQPLLQQGASAVEQVVSVLDAYGCSRDDFMETLRELQFKLQKDNILFDRYEAMDSKVKAALTRHYNATEHKSMALVGEMLSSVKKKRQAAAAMDDDEEGDDPSDDDKSDDDVGDVSAFIKQLKKSTKKTTAKSTSSVKETKPKSKTAAKKK